MKILITGSNGLLGQKLVALLTNKEGITLLATSKGENRISNTNGYQYQSLDITNENEVATIFNSFKPDTIINTAAMTNVDSCESLQKECWKLNVTAVEFLIKYAEEHQAH